MELVIIASVAENGVIGRKGKMPWHIPADMKRFRRLTMGKPVIMGRKTFESVGRLGGRTNIVISRRKNFAPANVVVARSLKEALRRCKGFDTAYVIGGGEVYKQFLPYVKRMEITHVHRKIAGDTYFPRINRKKWKESNRIDRRGFSFVTYVRTRK